MNLVIISDDKNLLQINVIHKYLSEEAYWCMGIPKSIVENAIRNSLCYGGLYEKFNFKHPTDQKMFMELKDPDVYKRAAK